MPIVDGVWIEEEDALRQIDFFQWQVKRGRLHGDPTLLIERARSRQVYRTTSVWTVAEVRRRSQGRVEVLAPGERTLR